MWTIFTRPFSHWCEHHAVYESQSDVHTLILIQNCRHTRCAHRQFKYFYYTTLISITITLHIAASQPAKNVIILSDWWGIYCNSKAFQSNLNANWWHQLGIFFVPKLLLLFPRTFDGTHKWYSRSFWLTNLYKDAINVSLSILWSQLAFLWKKINLCRNVHQSVPAWHRLCIYTASHATETIETMIEIFNIYHHHLNSINILSIIYAHAMWSESFGKFSHLW